MNLCPKVNILMQLATPISESISGCHPISKKVVQCRIADLTSDILENLSHVWRPVLWKTSLHLYETADISNCSQRIAPVRYVHVPKTTTKAKDVLQFVKDFFVSTDSAPATLGNKLGFLHWWNRRFHACKILITVPCIFMLWHQNPCLRNWRNSFISAKIINWARGRALNHRLFKSLVKILEVNIQFYFSTSKSAGSHMGEF